MNKKDLDLTGCVGLATGGLLLLAVSAILKGVVLKTLWAWFVAPFFSLPPLSIAHAYGIALVWGYLSPSNQQGESDEYKALSPGGKVLFTFAKVVTEGLLILGLGYIATQFIP